MLSKIVDDLKKFLFRSRDQRRRVSSSYALQIQSGQRVSKAYVWDLSINGVGLLAERTVRFDTNENVTVTFPLQGGKSQVVRAGTVKTSKIYQPKPSREPIMMLRCSIAFNEPLSQEEFDAVSVESHINY
jgi:hypothetical protein